MARPAERPAIKCGYAAGATRLFGLGQRARILPEPKRQREGVIPDNGTVEVRPTLTIFCLRCGKPAPSILGVQCASKTPDRNGNTKASKTTPSLVWTAPSEARQKAGACELDLGKPPNHNREFFAALRKGRFWSTLNEGKKNSPGRQAGRERSVHIHFVPMAQEGRWRFNFLRVTLMATEQGSPLRATLSQLFQRTRGKTNFSAIRGDCGEAQVEEFRENPNSRTNRRHTSRSRASFSDWRGPQVISAASAFGRR